MEPQHPPAAAAAAPQPLESQLFYAVRGRDLETVRRLLNQETHPQLNVNWRNPDIHLATPLHSSCFFKFYDAFRLLMDDPRTDLNLLNFFGSTPFSMACFNDSLLMVRDLLRDPRTQVNLPNVRLETPLWRAVHSGNVEVIKAMLACERKIDTTTRSVAGSLLPHTTPAELARLKNFPDLARVMEEYEENPEKIRFQLRLLLGEKGLHSPSFPFIPGLTIPDLGLAFPPWVYHP